MAVISIGSGGRVGVPELRLPPGQRLLDDWPVLTAGLTTDVGAHEWTITITTETGHRALTGFERAPLRGATAVTGCVQQSGVRVGPDQRYRRVVAE